MLCKSCSVILVIYKSRYLLNDRTVSIEIHKGTIRLNRTLSIDRLEVDVSAQDDRTVGIEITKRTIRLNSTLSIDRLDVDVSAKDNRWKFQIASAHDYWH